MLKTNVHISDSYTAGQVSVWLCVCVCVHAVAPVDAHWVCGFPCRRKYARNNLRDDHRWCFRHETVFRRASPAEPSREREREGEKKSRHPENTRQLLRAAGERNHPLTHACTVHSHNYCKTALFFHDPSSRKKQHFVRRKVFIQRGITCVYSSLSLSHESTWPGPGFHVVRTAGNRRKFSCAVLCTTVNRKSDAAAV